MTQQEINQEIQRLVGKIVREYDPEKVVLYGSRAWGEPEDDSDIDLFIIKQTTQDPLAMMRDVDRIIYDRTVAVDALVYTPQQCDRRLKMGDPLIKKIFADGKVLYERPSATR